MKDNQDLLDLCTLLTMEENIKDSSSVDRDSTMEAIDYKKRQLAEKITSEASQEMTGKHTTTKT